MIENLASFEDFGEYKRIPPAILGDERLQTAVLNAQRGVIRDLLGKALYHDLINNRTVAKYVSLLDGATYSENGATVQFHGLKPAILWYAYAIALQDLSTTPTKAGLKVKEAVGGGTTVDQTALNDEKSRANAQGDMYAQEVREYLDANVSTYPLWPKKLTDDRDSNNFKASVIVQPQYNYRSR